MGIWIWILGLLLLAMGISSIIAAFLPNIHGRSTTYQAVESALQMLFGLLSVTGGAILIANAQRIGG